MQITKRLAYSDPETLSYYTALFESGLIPQKQPIPLRFGDTLVAFYVDAETGKFGAGPLVCGQTNPMWEFTFEDYEYEDPYVFLDTLCETIKEYLPWLEAMTTIEQDS